jgi:nucleoside-diphosphate-sugar epimerase
MRVLLTGASGWLGRFLAPRLRAAGHVVIGLDPAPGADTQILGSVADRTVVERAFGEHGVNAVVHAGALYKPDIVRVPPRAFIDVNVTGTLNLLEAAAAAGCDRFVLTSTTSVMISPAIREETAAAAVWLDFPDAPTLYARRGWRLPTSIGRVYDAGRIERVLGFRCRTDFGRVLDALRTGGSLPFAHDPGYSHTRNSDIICE